MSTVFIPSMTAAGRAAAINASATGVDISIDAVAFGSGAGYDTIDGDPHTALVSEVHRVAIVAGAMVTTNQARITAIWSAASGTTSITEIGFFAAGVLVMVWSRSSGGPLGVKTPGVDFVLMNDLRFVSVPAGSISITVDSSGGAAALIALSNHEAGSDPHTQYAKKESPTFSGTPLTPTAAAGTATTQIASTSFVDSSFAKLSGGQFIGTGATGSAISATYGPGGDKILMRRIGSSVNMTLDWVNAANNAYAPVRITGDGVFQYNGYGVYHTGNLTLPAPSIDSTQSMAVISSYRSLNTNFYNTSTRPITVEVTVSVAAGDAMVLYKDGQPVQTWGNNTPVTTAMSMSTIVLPGQAYNVVSNPSYSFTWSETS